MSSSWISIIEGKTQILVPSASIYQSEPSKYPAFFNTAARFNRDISIFLYRNSFDKSRKNLSFVDSLSGVGSRGLRVAKEIPQIQSVILNDYNSIALQASKASAVINDVFHKCKFSNKEVCSFLSNSNIWDNRSSIIDLDPFGSPSPYIDCLLRSVENEGIISVTATDTAVLLGVYPHVCFRKYYGLPIRSKYSLEVGTRLLISNIALVASRFDLFAFPIFAHAYRNYIRVYCKIVKSAKKANRLFENLGYVQHCFNCGNRNFFKEIPIVTTCSNCKGKTHLGGQMWIREIFDKDLMDRSILDVRNRLAEGQPHGSCKKNLELIQTFFFVAKNELDNIPFHYLNDEYGKLFKRQTLPLSKIFDLLQQQGYRSSPTIFSNYGFKTEASMTDIKSVLDKV
ncbi:tRNA (guanine-N1)-methyltransferase [Candidatus Nitrosocosmicus sp. SS]|jgi:tRNA (guanine26-N2/guanine27-N2)-dimethyltransferase|uniref:tRNA (guanine-N1)-methyltransferase n=1 Tax=Candidatus Nitrosocosmicus agrestis TaxID=2563600 RepID=UPI00122DDF63|nr:tRNA (guanine-N1)-methyltransferase [Candidatus Nitrosocosmicus sp. SS]KAA2282726.1 tRNA (guanine-N1)-methyltransferase [Candidatus Nitrosocosmicus sp. SS]KAF0870341.1 tRNA (guanine-N1)-methyltransferase [Candidatus Nitrosocosmicus sp. SS]